MGISASWSSGIKVYIRDSTLVGDLNEMLDNAEIELQFEMEMQVFALDLKTYADKINKHFKKI